MDEPRVPGSDEPSKVPLPCLPHVHVLVSLASKLARALARSNCLADVQLEVPAHFLRLNPCG